MKSSGAGSASGESLRWQGRTIAQAKRTENPLPSRHGECQITIGRSVFVALFRSCPQTLSIIVIKSREDINMVTLLRAWQVKQLLLITIGVVITTLICSACSSVSTVTVTVTVTPSPRATATSIPIPTATLVPTATGCSFSNSGEQLTDIPLPPGTIVGPSNAASQQVFIALCTPNGTQTSINAFMTSHLPNDGWHLFNPSKDFTGCALLNPSHNSIWAKDSAHAGSTLTWTIGPLPSWMMNECTNYEPPPSS